MLYGLSVLSFFFFFNIRFFSTSENNAKAVVVPHPCKTSRSFETVQILEEDYSVSVGKFLVLCRDMKLCMELRLIELHYKASAEFI